jgi:acyl-CoA thioesterase I
MANTRDMLTKARDWCPTLMILPLPLMHLPTHNARVNAVADGMGELCKGLGIAFIDLRPNLDRFASIWQAEANAGDGAHPNAAGYAGFAQSVLSDPTWQTWIEMQ